MTALSTQATTLIITSCAVAHFVITMVMALFARHRVKYLAIAWIMGIFAAVLAALIPYSEIINGNPGMMHPAMMLTLIIISYLQSIYPLSISMPGYLQWGRMWYYATPAIILLLAYIGFMALGYQPVFVHTLQEMKANIFSPDMALRVLAAPISCWYIVGIFRLPRRLTHIEIPGYLIGYCTALGLSAVFYLLVSVNYLPILLLSYLLIFSFLNLYLCFRTLESLAIELPKPIMQEVEEQPSEEELKKSEDDFNEANLQRFHRLEYWMQHHREVWVDNTFGRDRLCEEVGLNRHLMLQCLRSQGYNNVHDYINSYRVSELKRRIQTHRAVNLTDCLDVGFGTIRTLRNCFMKQEAMSIEDYLARYK